EVSAWEKERNDVKVQIDWQFTTDDARIKLKRLYPVLIVKYSD
ncbi:IS630 family transposase, partial [bacterium]